MHPANAAHLAHLRLVIERGNAEEKAAAQATLTEIVRVMEVAAELQRGVEMQPLEQVEVPMFLAQRAAVVAAQRFKRVEKFRLKEKGGARRNMIDEALSIVAQYAACLITGLHPTAAERTHQDAKANGNLGGNVSCFSPKEGSYNLLVSTTVPPSRRMILIHREQERWHRCRGWVYAGEVQVKAHEKTFHRDGVARTVYVVPSEVLRPIGDWFDGEGV